ncbi:hypothetical protein J8F10_35710 [Gemmata sp. G18]|uniref:Uncharacterized protein n=1 Tax=Gemmata palustris TaxID=2822762 RepID=A0ABS5C3N2_9BACT|nr:hypothetical protein [Gemmata palustris]MBP3960601.1 hypothetical protein [Gemmata palustris]
MAAWKVLIIGVLACACLALALATLLVTISHEGGQRWAWLAGLLAATICVSTILAFFMRHASGSLDLKTRGSRN